ncbi:MULTISPECIES: RHS repeat-associated core domain-containing protein [unclassified Lysobacter]|uniref:RHS repeat-associated core domain-containing protein n=1 Tax=unclassified Lysobacter TaxID=2635362 RepID=UPI001BE61A99|nr:MULTISPECIES: RHS repeat-associated core domain-containing protein [unclassified Lysobacter]MBT2748296.1 RHS repeat protein [Lysobacter sp. ISL-42]MBT2749937.1 RHS repeat protein [Lysobacter sp. ISL-50]MBT2781265.1 RHS repeat protein [Lysobacter sp. ISL-52]
MKKNRIFAVALSVLAAWSGLAIAQEPITPWNWKLTIYDASDHELENKEFTSRSAAEQYLWASSPLNATLKEVKLIKAGGLGAEYRYTGTRSSTTPGPYQYNTYVEEGLKWFSSESEAVTARKQRLTYAWGTSRKACAPIFEDEEWSNEPNPTDSQRKYTRVYVFNEDDPTCRPYWEFPYFNTELVNKKRITFRDHVKNQDGNFFRDPQPFTGLEESAQILHTGPARDPYGSNYTPEQWTVFSRRTAKLVGQPNHCSPIKGNPCDVARGSKYEIVTDAGGYGPLDLIRQYDSTDAGGSFGRGWHGPFDYSLMVSNDGNQSIVLTTPSGKQVDLTRSSGLIDDAQRYRSSDNRSATAMKYYKGAGVYAVRVEFPDMSIEFRYPGPGYSERPSSITYNGNQEVRLNYDTLGRIERAEYLGRSVKYVYEHTDTERLHKVSAALMPDGRLITYEYTADGNLDRVADDSGELFKYGYKAGTSLITSILESGEHPRGYQYDDLRRLIGSTNGPAQYGYAYQPTQTTVTFPSGRVEVTDFEPELSRRPVREETVGGLVTSTAYTYSGPYDIVTETDNAGLTTIRKYNSNSETVQTLLNNAVLRTILTTYEPGTSRPTRIQANDGTSNLTAQTDYTYNTRRQLTSVVRKDAKTAEQRTTTLTYCEDADLTAPASTCATLGALKSVDGPRTDVADTTGYDYFVSDAPGCAVPGGNCSYRKGDLWKINFPMGQTQEYLAYDGGGRTLGSKDSNGVVTNSEYDPRGRLAAQKIRGANDSVKTDDRITRFEYTPSGSVKQITLPDGTYTRFTYDAALRLTDITDNLGDVIHYTLDNAGNRKQEDVKAGGTTVRRTLSRAFNALGQLEVLKDASQNATSFRYDLGGNPDRTTDALGRMTDQTYDGLGRLKKTLQDVGGLAVETKLEYDPFDRLAGVVDPKGLSTAYVYNGFGDQTKLTSPDTGVTDYTYNAAGLLATKKDANDTAAHTYTYDALGRPKTVSYGSGSADVEYVYDTVNPACTAGETFASGRVTAMRTDGTELLYCYDRFGQIVRKTQTLAGKSFTLRHAYTSTGQLKNLTYPDGTVVDYVRDARARIKEIGVKPNGSVRSVLLTSASYEPFGPVNGWTYGNGRTLSRTYDLDYRAKTVLDNASGGLSLGYGYNAVGDLTELKDGQQSAFQAKYDYDTLGRLKVTRDGTTDTALETYGYDGTGNRLSVLQSAVTTAYTYPDTQHRLTRVGTVNRTYNAVGNTTSIGSTAKEFAYNPDDRLSQVKLNGVIKAGYRYNAIGERVAITKPDGTIDTYTLYDEAGNWIGDYTTAGIAKQQAVWLGGAPVGVLVGSGTTQSAKYVETDHLGTPRAVIDPIRNVAIWTWSAKGEAFGKDVPNQDPDLDGTAFVFNLRFPGQRFDAGSGFVYNYYRDYDPAVGRYLQSDPIGLNGGASTYAYAFNNSNSFKDPFGLQPPVIDRPAPGTSRIFTRNEFTERYGPFSSAVNRQLDRGCVGVASIYQGMGYNMPENAPGAQCFKTQDEAERKARECKNNVVWIKQGEWRFADKSNIKPNSIKGVSNNDSKNPAEAFNYVTWLLDEEAYLIMNYRVEDVPANGPQMIEIKSSQNTQIAPTDEYPAQIFCTTCPARTR